MSEDPATHALGGTTVLFGWVEESRVQEVLHASDGLQLLLAITLAGLGASIAVAVALAAGALHPIAMYLLLCGLLAGTVFPAIMTIREYRRYCKVRTQLLAGTARVPVPVMLVTPGAPSFTVGGQTTVTGLTTHGPVFSAQPEDGAKVTNSGGPDGEGETS